MDDPMRVVRAAISSNPLPTVKFESMDALGASWPSAVLPDMMERDAGSWPMSISTYSMVLSGDSMTVMYFDSIHMVDGMDRWHGYLLGSEVSLGNYDTREPTILS